MGDKSMIEWTDATWNPTTGCSKVSAGCKNCYAERTWPRLSSSKGPYAGRKFTDVACHPDRLDQPLRWKRPRRIFVDSMSDLFHEDVPDEYRDKVFAVMALSPQHMFQVLTKRPERMLSYCCDLATPFRIAKRLDSLLGAQEGGAEQIRPIEGYPGYFASSHGFIYSRKHGSQRRMKPDIGEQGHQRVQLHREGSGVRGDRLLIHRIILETFVGPSPALDAQARHRDGDPTNNAITNLLWGSQSDNWSDSKRHGSYRRNSKLTHLQVEEICHRHISGESGEFLGREYGVSATQIRNITSGRHWGVEPPIKWPVQNCWLGVSVEDQATADERIPLLLDTPAAVRFVSMEPLLTLTDITRIPTAHRRCQAEPDTLNALTGECQNGDGEHDGITEITHGPSLDWVVVGGESGPGARPIHPDWPRSVRDQCAAAGVPFFFKQWGEWAPVAWPITQEGERASIFNTAIGDYGRKEVMATCVAGQWMARVGKKAAGRLLDGRTHDEMPGVG